MSSTACPNCSAQLDCSCKLRTAKDGTQCCTRCVANYDAGIKGTATPVTKTSGGRIVPKAIVRIDPNGPNNVTVVYNAKR